MNFYFTNFFLPLLITFFSTKFALPYLKRVFNAKPTERGMHYFTKPSGGGIVFAIIYYLFALKERYKPNKYTKVVDVQSIQ